MGFPSKLTGGQYYSIFNNLNALGYSGMFPFSYIRMFEYVILHGSSPITKHEVVFRVMV